MTLEFQTRDIAQLKDSNLAKSHFWSRVGALRRPHRL